MLTATSWSKGAGLPEIEDHTGIPTFYYVVRYYGRGSADANRPCPLCGKPLEPAPGGIPQWCFQCRVLTEPGDDPSDPPQPPPRPESGYPPFTAHCSPFAAPGPPLRPFTVRESRADMLA